MSGAVLVSAMACVSAVGRGTAALCEALQNERPALRPCDVPEARVDCYVGVVDGLEDRRLDGGLSDFDCRNNRLAQLGLDTDGIAAAVQDAAIRYGPERVGVVMGTSTSGVRQAEEAYRRRDADGCLPPAFDFRHTHDLYSLAEFVRRRAGVRGPAYTVSTACSSSAKSFVDGAQLIAAGLCDAVLVGGVDTLCLTSLQGFNALQLLSPEPCRPTDAERRGISIGEAAAFALLERGDQPAEEDALYLLGYGESADAYHMSSPHPDGLGARLAMQEALRRARLRASEIGYVNMHGTGTPVNDRVEDAALFELFGGAVPCGATKGWTGHTLGAAGALEAVIALLALQRQFLPGTLNLRTPDPAFASRIQHHSEPGRLRTAMSNSFGFGGNNCSLIFGRA